MLFCRGCAGVVLGGRWTQRRADALEAAKEQVYDRKELREKWLESRVHNHTGYGTEEQQEIQFKMTHRRAGNEHLEKSVENKFKYSQRSSSGAELGAKSSQHEQQSKK